MYPCLAIKYSTVSLLSSAFSILLYGLSKPGDWNSPAIRAASGRVKSDVDLLKKYFEVSSTPDLPKKLSLT